jgi:hypothetical protein
MDAFYILQKAVDLIGLPFPGAGVAWDFDPPERAYEELSSDQSGQDFTAVLLGDVSGNWPAAGDRGLMAAGDGPVMIRVQGGTPSASGTATATVSLEPQGAQVYGLDLRLTYDPDTATAEDIELIALAEGWMMAANLDQPGEVAVSLAGALPITGAGPLLALRFQLADPMRATAIELTEGEINEGAVAVQLIGGELGGARVYLPMVLRAD